MINQEKIAFYTTLFYVWSIFGLFITHVTLSGTQYYYIKNLILKEAFYKNEEFFQISNPIMEIFYSKKFIYLKKIISFFIFLRLLSLVLSLLFGSDFLFTTLNITAINLVFFLMAIVFYLVSISELKYIFFVYKNKKKDITFYFFSHFSILKNLLSFYFIFTLGINVYTQFFFNKTVGQTFNNYIKLETNPDSIFYIFLLYFFLFGIIIIFIIIFIIFFCKKCKNFWEKVFSFFMFLPIETFSTYSCEEEFACNILFSLVLINLQKVLNYFLITKRYNPTKKRLLKLYHSTKKIKISENPIMKNAIDSSSILNKKIMLSIVKNRKHKEFQLQTVNILNTLQFKFNIFFYKIFYSFFFKLILLLCFSILTNLLLQDLTFCRPAPISNVLVDKLPNRANFVDPDFFWLDGRTNESHFFLVYKCPEIRNCVGLKFYSIEDFTTSDTISYHTVQRCCKETIISSSNTKYNGITLTCVNPVKKVMSPGTYYASDTCNSLGDYYWNFSKKNTILIIDKANGSKKLIGVNSSNIHILND